MMGPMMAEVAVTARRDPVWGEVLVAVYRGEAEAAALVDKTGETQNR